MWRPTDLLQPFQSVAAVAVAVVVVVVVAVVSGHVVEVFRMGYLAGTLETNLDS